MCPSPRMYLQYHSSNRWKGQTSGGQRKRAAMSSSCPIEFLLSGKKMVLKKPSTHVHCRLDRWSFFFRSSNASVHGSKAKCMRLQYPKVASRCTFEHTYFALIQACLMYYSIYSLSPCPMILWWHGSNKGETFVRW